MAMDFSRAAALAKAELRDGSLGEFAKIMDDLQREGLFAEGDRRTAAADALERSRKLREGGHALLVGVDNYKKPGIANLSGALDDVRVMEQLVPNRLGIRKRISRS